MPPLPSSSSIKSTLEGHLEKRKCPALQGLESLAEELTLGHGVDVWTAAVEFKRR